MQKESIINIINKYKRLADTTQDRKVAYKYGQIACYIEDNFEILEEDAYQYEWQLLGIAYKKQIEKTLKIIFEDRVYLTNETTEQISLSVQLSSGELIKTKKMRYRVFYDKLPELLNVIRKKENELFISNRKKRIEERLKIVFADYEYFTNETTEQISLSVHLSNGKLFETAKMSHKAFYDKLPSFLIAIKEVEHVMSKSKFKFNVTPIENEEVRLRIELERSAPSKLKFNSYSELCEYCNKSENFTNYNAVDILEIINAAEKFFPLRLNELAKLHKLPKPKGVMVCRSSQYLGCSYFWSRYVGLNIDLLCYNAKGMEETFVHELCHFVIPNHSENFYNLLYSKVKKRSETLYKENKELSKIFAQFYDSKTAKKRELVKYFQEKQNSEC